MYGLLDPPALDEVQEPKRTMAAQLTEAVEGLSVSDSSSPEWSAEELDAFREVKRRLLADGVPEGRLGDREVVLTTMCSKLRPDKAVAKFGDFFGILDEYQLDPGKGGFRELEASDWAEIDQFWDRYSVTGRDVGGRGIMWINGGRTEVEEEQRLVRTSCMFYYAAHADMVTLRDGITMVIDTSNAPTSKVGNERKLQRTWQAYPLRPQNIFIVGASFIKRLTINALIKIASLVTSNKVIGRVQFVELPGVRQAIGEEDMPAQHGGKERPPVKEWVKARLAGFPTLPDGWFEG